MDKLKSMINEGWKYFNKNDSNPTVIIKMKLDKRIFVHEDSTDSRFKVKKPRVNDFSLGAVKGCAQQITKNCNPLGKFVDLLGDDIDSMNKEYANWIKDNKLYNNRFDETLFPL